MQDKDTKYATPKNIRHVEQRRLRETSKKLVRYILDIAWKLIWNSKETFMALRNTMHYVWETS